MNTSENNTDENVDIKEEDETATELRCHCPDHYPDWDNQDVDLSRKCVHMIGIPTFLHMPLAYEFYRRKQAQDIENLELPEKWPGFSLAKMGALRGRLIRILEDIKSPSRHVTYLERSFTIRGKLHPGDLGTIKHTLGDMQMKMIDEGCRPKELYLGYLTCPACEERKGGAKILIARRWVPMKKHGRHSS